MKLGDQTIEVVHGQITRIASDPRIASKGGYLFRGLELQSESKDGRIFIMFPEFSGEDLYEFPLLCWENAQITAYGLHLNNRLNDNSVIYIAVPDSYLILEPYRPISVTDAVEAAACPRRLDIKYRVKPDDPFWLAKGKLIHNLFRHLLINGDQKCGHPFEQVFQEYFSSIKTTFIGTYRHIDLDELEKETRIHFDNLNNWLNQNRGSFSFFEIEGERISSQLGLKGRADAIFYDDHNKIIIELKSTKTPTADHHLQLLGYCMLFENDAGSRLPEALVFYSAFGNAEKLESSEDGKRSILQGRNRAVALKYCHSIGRDLPIDYECKGNEQCFSRSTCYRLYGNPSRGSKGAFRGPERQYYEYWFKFLSADLWAQEGDYARILDSRSLSERIKDGATIPILEIKPRVLRQLNLQQDYIPRSSDLFFEDFSDVEKTGSAEENFARADIEIILPEIAIDMTIGEEVLIHKGDPCDPTTIRARIIDSDGRRIFLRPNSSFRVGETDFQLVNPQEWFLDRVPFSRARESSRYALLRFFSKAHRNVVRFVVRGETWKFFCKRSGELRKEKKSADKANYLTPPQFSKPVVLDDDLTVSQGLLGELNDSQKSAVKAALECDVTHLIHGPPGTGKTRVLARLIHLCVDRGERVLIVCPTNVALDRLLLAIIKLGIHDFLRVGGRSSASRELIEALSNVQGLVLLDDLSLHIRDWREFRTKIFKAQVVGATAYQCAAHPMFLRRTFDRVIVDEAGQLDEPATLAPLTLAPKFILCGDHLQLPPVARIKSGNSGIQSELPLEHSLFERLYLSSDDTMISSLQMQYRMNLEIQNISSRIFYNGNLYPAPEVKHRRLRITPNLSNNSKIDKIIDPNLPVVFVDIEGSESGKARPKEAEIACNIVRRLVNLGIPSHEIGIITPYRAQQSLIRKHFADMGGRVMHLSVDTVDRFQGGEREVIILSLARSDEVTSFLADRKRLNVSLTRARSKLILLGHGPILRENELFRAVLEDLETIHIN